MITYAEFESMVRGFAAAMAGRGPSILIALPQGPEAYAAMLAAGLAGCFYTPVNTEAPLEKLRHITRILQPNLILAMPALFAALSAQAPAAAPIHTPQGRLPGPGTRHPTAYIIFTSGSTGAPKGVVIPRPALNHYIAWAAASGTITPTDRVSQFPNIAFDLSVLDIYGTLCAGATLHPFLGLADRTFPARAIARAHLTVWNSTPSVLSLMLRAGAATAQNFRSLRLLNFCGEPLLPAHVTAVHAAAPAAILQNTYGPTEATVSITALRITPENAPAVCAASVAIGAPIPGMSLHLLGGSSPDEGEIVITGPQLATGYYRDSAKTAAAFRTITLNNTPTRAYFTGDWAFRRGGHIFFRERADHQVKIHGFRLELDEVAGAIHAQGYPAACVLLHQGELAAVIEMPESHPFNAAALRLALAETLEKHAIPTLIRRIPAMPRTANDKLDRQAVADWLTHG